MGGLKMNVGMFFGGLLLMVIGYSLFSIIISSAATAGSNSQIGSFVGTRGISDLGPLVFVAAVIVAGVGLIGVAGYRTMKGQ